MDIHGLRDFWERRTQHRPTPPEDELPDRMLLDTLGIGIEQTAVFLATEQPDFPKFVRWIEQVAGPPERARVARYHAALDKVPPPPGTQAMLAAIDAMPDVLSAEGLAHWHLHGYVVLRGAISRDEAAAAAAFLWMEAGADPDNPDSWYGPRQQGLMVQIFQHPTMEAARRSLRIHKAFAQLWGMSDLWSTTDRMSFNAPERPGHAFRAPRLHWDVSLVAPIPFATQGILYLSDTAEDQGALELVPGFHHRIDAWLNELGDRDPREVDLSADAIRVPAGAGDLVIWRQDLPHGASPNRAAAPRLAHYVNMYAPTMTVQSTWR